MSLDGLVKNLNQDVFRILKKDFSDKWQYLFKNLLYPHEYFTSIDDYQKPVDNLKKEVFFSKLENKCPDDEDIERTKEVFKKLNIKNGEEITQLFLKSDVLLLACVFGKLIKV